MLLRVGLTQSSNVRDVKIIAITSAVSREGKTSFSYALAGSLRDVLISRFC